MKTTTEDTAELVTTQSQLEAAIELALKQSRVAVDLESNGFYHYPERVCLVQLAVGDSVYLIDPLALEDPSPLGELLADAAVEKVFHSADYDIRSLDRDWGFSAWLGACSTPASPPPSSAPRGWGWQRCSRSTWTSRSTRARGCSGPTGRAARSRTSCCGTPPKTCATSRGSGRSCTTGSTAWEGPSG